MTTLILGCGYLGRRLGRLLADRGESVFGTTRTPARAAELADWGVKPVLVDVLDPISLKSLPAADRVFYAVGFDRRSGVPMRTVYVDGLRNVLDTLARRPLRFVYASATSVYGVNDGGWVDETSPTEPTTDSGRICLDAETLLLTQDRTENFAPLVVRYSGLYGPGRILRRDALFRNEPISGDPAKFLNLIHVDDAAHAALAALDRGEAGRVYLATDDRPLPRGECYRLTASLLGAPEPRFVTPAPGSPEARREEANKRVSNRRIQSELGLTWLHTDVNTGLPDAIGAERRDGSSSPAR